MSKPSDIPQDVWDAARDVVFDFDCDWTSDGRTRGAVQERDATILVARAITAERERCARLAEMFPVKGGTVEECENAAFEAKAIATAIRKGD